MNSWIDRWIYRLRQAPRSHPGDIHEPRMHPGSTQKASRRHPGGTQEASRSPGNFGRHLPHKSLPLSRQMHKSSPDWSFYYVFLIVRARNTVNCCAKCSLAAPTQPQSSQGPFTNTVRTPTAKDCLGNNHFFGFKRNR